MQRRYAWAGGMVLGFVLLHFCSPASYAVITRLTPLKEVLTAEQFILIAKVESVDPDKPAAIFQVDENLKAKAPFARMPVNLKGDAEAEKEKHTLSMVKRLAKDLPVIIFASKKGKRYTAFAYTNGTWFQMIGHIGDDPGKVTWAFLHCEPYLRRTFKGTTAELKQVIVDGLAGKKEPPEPNEKEKPGLGPEITPTGKQGGARLSGGPIFAVIPTVAIGGPLAILTMLFPTLFGRPKDVLRRWLVFFTVASVNSLIYLVHTWFEASIKDTWFGSQLALWSIMALVTLVGVVWSWRRSRSAVQAGQTEETPPRGEEIVLRVLSLIGLILVPYCYGRGILLEAPWKELLVMWVVVWAGTLYLIYRPLASNPSSASRPILTMEGCMLGALALACMVLGVMEVSPTPAGAAEPIAPYVQTDDEMVPRLLGRVWTFKADDPGTIDSTPLIVDGRVYVAAAHGAGFQAYGTVYCLEQATGKKLWSFDDDGNMKQIFSSPCLAEGRLYIGEGYHQDSSCKLYSLKADTGEKVWAFPTKSHTESSPCVAGGKVFFGAGDDGVYCLNASDGKELWHFEGLHVDTSPAVVGNRLYGGSGYGDRYFLFCLDTATGNPMWRTESKLPAFGSPTVLGNQVFFGLGNGDLLKSDVKPAGALLCVDARNGATLWQTDVPDAVHDKPAIDRRHVYFGSRDRHLYCVHRKNGQLVWKQDLGSPVVTSPVLVGCSLCGDCTGVYAAASAGRVCCLDPDSGAPFWTFEVSRDANQELRLFSSPQVVVKRDHQEERRQLFFGVGLGNPKKPATAMLYCLEDQYRWPVDVGQWPVAAAPK